MIIGLVISGVIVVIMTKVVYKEYADAIPQSEYDKCNPPLRKP